MMADLDFSLMVSGYLVATEETTAQQRLSHPMVN